MADSIEIGGEMVRVEETINGLFAQVEKSRARQGCTLEVRGRISQKVVTLRELDSIQFVEWPSVDYA